MGVHSVAVTNTSGMLLFSKYFDRRLSSYDHKAAYERSLFRATKDLWAAAEHEAQSVHIMDVYVVFQQIGQLLFFLSGTDECDELIRLMMELMHAFPPILTDHCDGRIDEQHFLTPDTYGKFAVSVDEMLAGGVVETLDTEFILRMTKLKQSS